MLVQVPGAPALHVRPPWEPPSEVRGALEIVIDPGQAFGTGAHHTTRLCLEILLGVRSEDRRALSLLDVGTGSGVLALAAFELGFEPVSAFDNDPESISAAGENAAANGASLLLGSARPAPRPAAERRAPRGDHGQPAASAPARAG